MPNDDEEVERLDNLQFVCSSFVGANVVAPISRKPSNILDIGCGSGAWCVEVADQYTSAVVVGMDLSPIQPTLVPDNCEFIVADLTQGLDFHDGSQDLVQSRIMMSGVTKDHWPLYMDEIYRICKPGTGWAQIIETSAYLYCDDNSVPKESKLWEYQKYEHEMFEVEKGFLWDPWHVEGHLRGAGFVDIQIRLIHVKVGDWVEDPRLKAAGKAAIKVWSGVVGPLVDKMEKWLETENERTGFTDAVTNDMANPGHHLYSPMICAIGRKPKVNTEGQKMGKNFSPGAE